jgi:hypothetical protein
MFKSKAAGNVHILWSIVHFLIKILYTCSVCDTLSNSVIALNVFRDVQRVISRDPNP